MKFVKKLTALFLAVVMVMAMGITAFAVETATITIDKPVTGHSYKVYQMLVGDVADLEQATDPLNGGSSGTLSNTTLGTSVDTAKAANVDAVLAALQKSNPDGTKSFKTGADLGDAAYALIDTSKQVATLSTGTKTATVDKGYYIIVDEYSASITGDNVVYSRNMVTVNGNTTITPKTETPKIDKNIIDIDHNEPLDKTTTEAGTTGGKNNTAAIGDIIEFQVDGKVPNMDGYKYYYYVLDDTLSKGLTLNDDYVKGDATKTGGFTVTIGSKTLTRGTDYDVYTTKNNNGTTTFKLAMIDLVKMTGIKAGDAITIKYNATVNKDAETGNTANTNEATLIFSNNPNDSEQHDKTDEPGNPDTTKPTGKTPTVETNTYVTELSLEKVNKDGNFVDALKGAEFTLTGKDLVQVKFNSGTHFEQVTAGTGSYYKLKDGTYTTEAPIMEDTESTKANKDLYETTTKDYNEVAVATATTADGGSYKVTATVDSTGKITFTGLNAGTYTLTESKTPAGYNTVDPIEFEIKATYDTESKTFTWSNPGKQNTETGTTTASPITNNNNGTFSIKVKNYPGSTLPSTGGMGTTVIYAAGIALIVAAGVVVIVKKRFA